MEKLYCNFCGKEATGYNSFTIIASCDNEKHKSMARVNEHYFLAQAAIHGFQSIKPFKLPYRYRFFNSGKPVS